MFSALRRSKANLGSLEKQRFTFQSLHFSYLALRVVIWIGVNDVGMGYDPQKQLKLLFEVQVELLYNAGARNFVFFNVPPTDRSPAGILTGFNVNHRQREYLVTLSDKEME